VCTLRCRFRLQRWENFLLHNLQENGLSPLCTLVWFSRLKRSVKLFLHTSHMKCRSRFLKLCISLPLGANDMKQDSQRVIASLSRSLVWLFILGNIFLHISHESNLTSLSLSGKSALSLPTGSSTLISFMEWAASVRVVFNLTLWKENKLHQVLSREDVCVIFYGIVPVTLTFCEKSKKLGSTVSAHFTQKDLPQPKLSSCSHYHVHGSCIGIVASYAWDNMDPLTSQLNWAQPSLNLLKAKGRLFHFIWDNLLSIFFETFTVSEYMTFSPKNIRFNFHENGIPTVRRMNS
jgi:hypothetical protein